MPGRYEQMWTRTEDGVRHELCCIPFFPYGLSLGDVITLMSEDTYRVESKSGHRTIRIAFTDEHSAHRFHDELHGGLVAIGVATEFRGPHGGYGAIDISDDGQAAAVIKLLGPLVSSSLLLWEWADPS